MNPQILALLTAMAWVIGGEIVAGSTGMLCTTNTINGAPLSKGMPIAFTSPSI